MMKWTARVTAGFTMLLAVAASFAQTKANRQVVPAPEAHYFQLTLNLKFGANGEQQETTQTMTTEFAVRGSIPGSCKARMVSQYPTGSGTGTRYVELGTKFDADDIHLEGAAVALHFVLSASRPVKMIRYKGKDGVEMEEPIIRERNVELSIKLPLNQSKTVFDSGSKVLNPLGPLPGDPKNDPAAESAAAAVSEMPKVDQPLVISMTVSELK